MAAKFPTALPTADDWSTTNAGMGRTKSNDKSVNDLNVNVAAEEYNQQNLEIIAIAEKIGLDRAGLTDSSDSDYANVGEILDYMTYRADKSGFIEHFITRSGVTFDSIFVTASGGTANLMDADAIGVKRQTLQVATDTGWASDDLFWQRTSYMRMRWRVDTISGSWANGDFMRCGLYDVGAPVSYVEFYVAMSGGSWPNWTVRIDDGSGGTASDTLTVAPTTGWHVFEILTTSTGATFWHDRGAGTASEDSKALSQAPRSAKCYCNLKMNEAAGGDHLDTDIISMWDTRIT